MPASQIGSYVVYGVKRMRGPVVSWEVWEAWRYYAPLHHSCRHLGPLYKTTVEDDAVACARYLNSCNRRA